ncbi:MAG: hypothetical protein ACYS0C_09435 [Planctomycetota bacterium]|jgi:amino acid transporter
MEGLKKPSMVSCVLLTAAIVCCLISLLLMIITGKYTTGLLLFQALTMGLLIISSIINWRVYCKKFVDFEVQNRLKKEAEE